MHDKNKKYKPRFVSGDVLICIPKAIAEEMEIEKGQEFEVSNMGETIAFTRVQKGEL